MPRLRGRDRRDGVDIWAIDPRGDRTARQALWRAAWRDTYGPALGPARLHLIDEAVAEPAVLTTFAADGGGFVAAIVGVVVGSLCFAERHRRGHAWGIYVHSDHQRRGIGSARTAGRSGPTPRSDRPDEKSA